ncbi:MAG: hypothetical protein HND44_05750 [Chloroflexi bacterium]|nr:hypothetical protein [Ardenticatenaceae bacterium]MBL1127991.1 hypothetical protein [Chloroflexota bacterium]NOG34063.1 hypothetical protein [Chloroflexota bacterium]GIK54481.1 MAG: hypothetical protein BroJett015_01440 [Chloroflexota bacterium]
MESDELKLFLLGGLQIRHGRLGDLTPDLARSKKAQAILCYLALNTHTHYRRDLAGKFWGDKSEKLAQGSLRVAINLLRSAGLEPYLVITNNTLSFDLDSAYWCDAEAFDRLLARYRRGDDAGDAHLLRQAADLYRGDFLDGFTLGDTLDFDDWVVVQRQHWRELALTALDELVNRLSAAGQYAEGITYASRQLTIDPLREPTHRQLMWLLARSGQRQAALEQYEKCREWLLLQLGAEPEEETTAVYEAIKSAPHTSTRPLPWPSPFLPTETTNPPFQAPPRAPHFVGRSQTLTGLEAALRAPVAGAGSQTPPRWGIVGMGGVGKTTLAIHLAHRLRPYFPDGVLWATAVSDDPMQIAETWAAALGYDFAGQGTLAERGAALRAMLAEKKALLVVDDVTLAAPIKLLLPESGACAILLTGRREDTLRSLGATLMPLSELEPDDGRQLLTHHIGAERAAANAPAVADICDLLQNLPLAVALAGGYLNYRPHRPLTTFVAQLRQETGRLSLDHENREVRATLSISWQGLDEVQRHVFRHLGVFNGRAFTPEAAAAITEMALYPTLDRLDELVRLSLLTSLPGGGEWSRYRQHALLADFAREQLGDAGARQAADGRMAAYFLSFAAAHRQDYAALRPEWANLDAGLAAAYQRQLWAMVLDYTAVLQPAWFARGHYTFARQAFAWAAQAAMMLEDNTAVANAWLYSGIASMEQGDFDEAWQKLTQSLAQYRELKHHQGVTAVQRNLARIALDRAGYDEVQALLAESLHISQTILADDAITAELLYLQARRHHRQGQNEIAWELAQQAVEMQDQVGDRRGLVRTLRLQAFIAIARQDLEVARMVNSRALALAEELNDINELAMAYRGMVQIHWRNGDLAAARQSADFSMALLKKIGDRKSQALVQFQYLLIDKAAGAYQDALAQAALCLPVFEELGYKQNIMFVCYHVGDCLAALGNQPDACHHWQRALALAQELQLPDWIRDVTARLDG